MNDNLMKIYEDMYGSKNTIQQVEQAINANLRGSSVSSINIIEEYNKAMDNTQHPNTTPAKLQNAKAHIPEEIKPAIEVPKELSPAVDSSENKNKNTKTITDKEKKKMATHKFSFDELYKVALREQMEPGDEMMGDMGDDLGGGMEGDIEGEGADEVTLTISRDAAQTLCDVLQAALGGDEEDLEDDLGDDLGGEDLGDEGEEDLGEATDMDKAPKANSGQADRGGQKVMDPTVANKDLNFIKANIDPNKNVKVNKPKELNYKTTK